MSDITTRKIILGLALHSVSLRNAGIRSVSAMTETGWTQSIWFIIDAESNFDEMCVQRKYDTFLEKWVSRSDLPKVSISRVSETARAALSAALTAEGIVEQPYVAFEFKCVNSVGSANIDLVWPPSILKARIEDRLSKLEQQAAELATLVEHETGC